MLCHLISLSSVLCKARLPFPCQQCNNRKTRKLIWRKGSNGRNIDKDYNAQTCPNHLRSSQIHSCFWSNGFGKCSSHMSDVFCSAFSFSSLKTWPQLKGSTTEGIHDLSDACYTVTPKYTKVYQSICGRKHLQTHLQSFRCTQTLLFRWSRHLCFRTCSVSSPAMIAERWIFAPPIPGASRAVQREDVGQMGGGKGR